MLKMVKIRKEKRKERSKLFLSHPHHSYFHTPSSYIFCIYFYEDKLVRKWKKYSILILINHHSLFLVSQ